MPTTGSWCQRRWTDSLSGPDVHKLCTFTNSLRKYYTPKSELPVPYSVFHSQHHALAETCQGMSWRIRRILIDHHQDIARANTSLAMWARWSVKSGHHMTSSRWPSTALWTFACIRKWLLQYFTHNYPLTSTEIVSWRMLAFRSYSWYLLIIFVDLGGGRATEGPARYFLHIWLASLGR